MILKYALILWIALFMGASWIEQEPSEPQQIAVVINDTCTEEDYIDDYLSCDYEDMDQTND